jgi:hypothetical protein
MTTLAEFPPLIPHHHPPSNAGRLKLASKATIPQSPGGSTIGKKKTFDFSTIGKKKRLPEAAAPQVGFKLASKATIPQSPGGSTIGKKKTFGFSTIGKKKIT